MKTSFAILIATLFAFGACTISWAQENSSVQRPVTQDEIDRLKRQIGLDTSSSVEAITDYHTESGDLNNRLDFLRYGGRLNLKWGSASRLELTGTRTNYLPISSTFNEQGTNFTVGVQSKLSDSVAVHVEGGVTRFSTDTNTINAAGSMIYNPTDNAHVYVSASRNNVEESLLSTTGIRPVVGPFAGQLVGRIMENRVAVGGSSRLLDNFDIFGEGGFGNRGGSNVPSNFFRNIGAGTGYSILARSANEPLTLLRVAYELNYFGYDQNRSGFGGASLLTRGGLPIASTRIGSDGISPIPGIVAPGIGGYFSPNNFVSNIARVEAKGGSDEGLSYKISAFLGTQTYTGTDARWANGLSATVNVGITERVSLPVTYLIDNFGPFTQQSLFARLVVRF